MIIQTVCTVSYLPLSLALYSSVQRSIPHARFSIVITDLTVEKLARLRVSAIIPDSIELLTCEEIGFTDSFHLREQYSPLEFNSACKVAALDYQLFSRNNEECLFLDPDVVIYPAFAQFLSEQNSSFLLFPNTLSPQPTGEDSPSDLSLLVSGQINGGCIFARQCERVKALLSWLRGKVDAYWFVAPAHGMYADQLWLSQLPYLFSDITKVSLHPGANVAYWNFYERFLREVNGEVLTVNGEPLLYIHFSGLQIPSHGRVSQYSNRVVEPITRGILQGILKEYEARVLALRMSLKSVDLRPDLFFGSSSLRDRMKLAAKLHNVHYQLFDFEYEPTSRFAAEDAE